MSTLNKVDIEAGLQKEIGLTNAVAKEMVNQVFEAIRTSLEEGQPVKISGFGKFILRNKKARLGRNPKTGDSKLIKARRVVTFKAGQALKGQLQAYSADYGAVFPQSPL